METRSVALIGLYVFVAFFIYVWLAIPPGAAWDRSIHWGDVATWVSSIATFTAVGVALYIPRHEVNARRREKVEEQSIEDFRVSLLLGPLVAAVIVASEAVVVYAMDTKGFFLESEKDSLLDRDIFKRMGDAAGVSERASPNLSVWLLQTIAFSREMEAAIEDCFKLKKSNHGLIYEFSGSHAKKHFVDLAKVVHMHAVESMRLIEKITSEGIHGLRNRTAGD